MNPILNTLTKDKPITIGQIMPSASKAHKVLGMNFSSQAIVKRARRINRPYKPYGRYKPLTQRARAL